MSSDGEVVLPGIAAAAGLAVGRLLRPRSGGGAAPRRAGSAAEERAGLEAALRRAGEELQALVARSDTLAGEILGFQIALLEDEELVGPVLEAVAAGAAADAAWREALDREVADYAAAEDDYFRARAADLADLRDRVLAALQPEGTAEEAEGAEPAIYLAEDLTPSRFLETDWGRFRGAALAGGTASSHVAMLARARGVPLLVSLGPALARLEASGEAVLDAEEGRLIVRPSAATLAAVRGRQQAGAARQEEEARGLAEPAQARDGTRVLVQLNLDDPARLEGLDPAHCDGVGLTRTEFLFQGGRGLPDEESQLAVYRRLLAWAEGRPVVIRTLDAGGDKPIPGLTPEGEDNPFLGLRGLRLSLARPEVFRVQLRALSRAAAESEALRVMLPMVTRPSEVEQARALFVACVAELRAEGVPARLPPLGIMVEVPAAALTAEAFPVDFYSVGSNDLVQYVTATSRDNASVASLHDPRDPAVLALIRRVAEAGRARGLPVGLCGDMAGEPELVPLLLDAGLRSLSVAPSRLAATKAAVRRWPGPGDG